VNIGNTFEALNDFENARRSYKNAIQWFEEISSSSGIALAKLNLALVYEKEGEYEQAVQLCAEGLALSEQVANKRRIAAVCLNLGRLYSKKQGIKGDERGYSTLEQGSENVAFKQPKTRA
jgi:tetratricopeptide (TPR) repeat protein